MEGLSILLVEDEFLLACSLEDDLRSLGFSIVGPCRDLASARETAKRDQFDLAILDINLNGEMVYPLADDLIARGVPFIFLSGYSLSARPERFRIVPQVAKPYDPEILRRELKLIAASVQGAGTATPPNS